MNPTVALKILLLLQFAPFATCSMAQTEIQALSTHISPMRELAFEPDSEPELDLADVSEAEENNGQDPTRPLTRLDIRIKHQDLPSGLSAELLTLRVDKPFVLGDGWSVATRVDMPLVYTDVPSLDNPNGDDEFGVTDSLFQALFITPPLGADKRWAVGFGSQLIFPTGSQDQMGTGKWQLAPIVAARYALPELSKGSFAALLVKQQFSFAGDGDRSNVNDIVIQPVFSWTLPDQWFVGSSPEMRFNMREDGDAFIPLDINVGKMIAPGVVSSLQFDVPLVDDYQQYDWQLEFRVGFFF
jgi:hypothetical protein